MSLLNRLAGVFGGTNSNRKVTPQLRSENRDLDVRGGIPVTWANAQYALLRRQRPATGPWPP